MSISKRIKKTKLSLRYGQKNHYGFWRILNIIVSGILLAGVIFTVSFIYKNVNTALTNTVTIAKIRTQITFDALDTETYEQTKKTIEDKQSLKSIPSGVRFVFDYQTTTTIYEKNTTTTVNE